MKSKLIPWLLLLPFGLCIGFFCLGVVNGVVQSFGVIPAFDLHTPTLRYYAEVLRDPELLHSIGYSLWISLVSSVAAALLGTLLCYVIVSARKSRSVWINVIKLPVLIPHMVVALFIISIFSQTGLLARLLFHAGLISSADVFPKLLFDTGGVGIILAYLWKEIPFVCYFVLAVMANLSETLEEAALGLGATRWKCFTNITLPLCLPTVRGAFLIILAFSFGAYELPLLLGSTLPKALPVQAYIQYTHPDLQHRPYAMVLNVIMIVVSLLLCLAYFRCLGASHRAKDEVSDET